MHLDSAVESEYLYAASTIICGPFIEEETDRGDLEELAKDFILNKIKLRVNKGIHNRIQSVQQVFIHSRRAIALQADSGAND